MKILNDHLQNFGQMLHDLTLKGKDSRMRTRILKLVDAHIREVIAEETNSLIDQYAMKDEDGELILIGENQFKLVEETSHKYHEEIQELMNEYMHIEENEGNRDMLVSIANVFLDGEFEVSGDMAFQYDIWCEEFEKVLGKYKEDSK